MEKIKIKKTDALIIVDFQNDFCPGGALPVLGGDEIGETINRIGPLFEELVFATQDWHPENHCSFKIWPVHCVADTLGAEFYPLLNSAAIGTIIKKATRKDEDAYSAFDKTCLSDILRENRAKRIFVCGLATDYCVKATVLDGLKEKFEVFVVLDAIRAVNVNSGDGEKALEEMKKAGAKLIHSSSLY